MSVEEEIKVLGDYASTKGQKITGTAEENEVIYGGLGNDTIKDEGETSLIYANEGNNKITSSALETAIYADNGKNTIVLKDDIRQAQIVVKDGKNKITVGNDIDRLSVNAGDGGNTISVGNLYESGNPEVIIATGSGKDTIKFKGGATRVNIDAGEGNNKVTFGNDAGRQVILPISDDNPRHDIFEDAFANVKVETGAGKDTVKFGNNAEYVGVYSTDGKDSVTFGNDAKIVNVITADGFDTVKFGKNAEGILIDTGDGGSKITIGNGSGGYREQQNESVEPQMANPDLYMDNTFGLSIYGGDGNDKVTIGKDCKGAQIMMGDGNDTVKVGNGVEGLISVEASDGDRVTGKKNVTIGNAKLDELMETTAKAEVILWDTLDNNKVSIGSNFMEAEVRTSTGNDKITIGNNAGYYQSYNDYVDPWNYGLRINSSTGKDTITIGNDCKGAYIEAGSGYYRSGGFVRQNDAPDTIKVGNNAENLYIRVGDGGSKITIGNGAGGNYSKEVPSNVEESSIPNTRDVYDFFTDIGYNLKVDCAEGNDKVTIGKDCKGAQITMRRGNDTVKIGNNVEGVILVQDSDYYGDYFAGKKTVTIGNAKVGEGVDPSVAGVYINNEENDTVKIGKNFQGIAVETGAGNDKITIGATEGQAVINAGAGDDIIKTGAMENMFEFYSKIYPDDANLEPMNEQFDGYEAYGNDTITLAKGSKNILNYNGDGQNVILNHKKDLVLLNTASGDKTVIKDFRTKKHATTDVEVYNHDNRQEFFTEVYDYSNATKGQKINVKEFSHQTSDINVNDYAVSGSNYNDTINVKMADVDAGVYVLDGRGADKINVNVTGATEGSAYVDIALANDGAKDTIKFNSENCVNRINVSQGLEGNEPGSIGNDQVYLSKNDISNTLYIDSSTNIRNIGFEEKGDDLVVSMYSKGNDGQKYASSVTFNDYYENLDVAINGNAFDYDTFLIPENKTWDITYNSGTTYTGIAEGNEVILGTYSANTITAGTGEAKIIAAGSGADKVYATNGLNVVNLGKNDSYADTVYADKSKDFDITEDRLVVQYTGTDATQDALTISNQGLEGDLKVFFDVAAGENAVSDSLFIVSDITSDIVGSKGIEIEGFMQAGSYGFGAITNDGKTLDTTVINSIVENVQSWLGENTQYASASEALASGDDVSGLIACYTPAAELWQADDVLAH